MAIDIGSEATDRTSGDTKNNTYISLNNPATSNGTITSIEIWPTVGGGVISGFEVAIFYLVSGSNYSTRDYEAIPGNITAGQKSTFTVDLDIQVGDLIGCTWTGGASASIECDNTGGSGILYATGNVIPCTNQAFSVLRAAGIHSLHGIGVMLPTVTTQAVTDILTTTATGNGNITDTGGENCTKRGICYNITGNPTVTDSKVEETGSFGTGAFTESLINLDNEKKYYAKAYTYNSVGYAYGAEVEFTTLGGGSPAATHNFFGHN
jgi:hypothetical protein